MLDRIIDHKRKKLSEVNLESEMHRLESEIGALPKTVSLRESLITDPDISIIAEIKRMSPSRGILNDNISPSKTARIYESAGARAISVLTEDAFFGGNTGDLKSAKNSTNLPVLRKDFIIDEYQIFESRAIGSDAILLIAGILNQNNILKFYNLARHLGLEVIIEVHSLEELDNALICDPRIIGINNRNLNNFATDIRTFEKIAIHVPDKTLRVAESGIFNREDILYLKNSGADAVLIGESIIMSENPAAKISELRGDVS